MAGGLFQFQINEDRALIWNWNWQNKKGQEARLHARVTFINIRYGSAEIPGKSYPLTLVDVSGFNI